MDFVKVKMQGLGNRFVVCCGPDLFSKTQIVNICNEYGDESADGLLLVGAPEKGKVSMKYWNSDGSAAEMCGNGLRCVARFAVENGLVAPGEFTVVTDAGSLKAIWDGRDEEKIEVQVGKAKLNLVPAIIEGGRYYKVDIGNPHAVSFVHSADLAEVELIGPKVENNSEFPNKTNVEFVEVKDEKNLKVRTWERGVGETLACGTGMAASACAAVEVMGAEYPVTVEVLGGKATIWIDEDGYTRMVGPAYIVD